MKSLLTSILLFALPAMLSCGGDKKDAPSAIASKTTKHNVLLISIDTLRADGLKIYSPDGAETPALQALANESVVFEKVITPVPTTLPSHCSMLTGVYPVFHQVRDNVRDVLPRDLKTMAEIFKNEGYQTAAFLGSMVLGRHTGLDRGFEYYDDYFSRSDASMEDLGAIERPANEVAASFQHWFESKRDERPTFAFLHFYDPHSPYEPPSAFAPQKPEIRELYKGEIRYVDSVLNKVFADIKQKGTWDNTIVIVTSDHGEMLLEHDEVGHGYYLYRGALEVPLIIRIPGIGTRKVGQVVQLTDLAPTLFEASGIKNVAKAQGESLMRLLQSGGQKKQTLAFSESYFPALQLGTSPLKSAQDGVYKYIDAPMAELYDLRKDPNEADNIADRNQNLAKQFQQRLRAFEQQHGNSGQKPQQREVSAEEIEQFSALGYIGGSVPESAWSRDKDPKQYIDEWNGILQATALAEQRRYPDALKMIHTIKKEMPVLPSSVALLESRCLIGIGRTVEAEKLLLSLGEAPEAASALADLYARTGQQQKAATAYDALLARDFSYFTLYNYLALLVNSGKQPEASAVMAEMEKKHPPTDQNRPFLAEIYVLLDRKAEAEEQLQKLIEQRPWESKWYLALAGIYQSKGETDRALSFLTSYNERLSQDPDYLMRLGILYRMSNQPAKEIESFRKMMQLDSRDPRPYFYLAKAMIDYKGRPEVVIELCRRGFSLRPKPDMQIFGLYVLSDAYKATGNTAESQKAFQMAQQLEKMS